MPAVYAHRYVQMTGAETGKAGALFFHDVIAFNLPLVAVLVAAALETL